jgi:hypothetical protein
MKFISPTIHGIIDYLVVIFLLLTPTIFGFAGIIAIFTYALAFVHLALSLLTNYPLGLLKLIPVNVHAGIEVIVGIALIVLAYTWFKDNIDGSKLFYVIFGTVILLTWLVTDYTGIHDIADTL